MGGFQAIFKRIFITDTTVQPGASDVEAAGMTGNIAESSLAHHAATATVPVVVQFTGDRLNMKNYIEICWKIVSWGSVGLRTQVDFQRYGNYTIIRKVRLAIKVHPDVTSL